MDDRTPTLRYGPNRLIAVGAGVAALAFLGLVIEGDDRAGRLLYGLAVLVLAVVCVSDLVWNPRLTLTAAGLRLRTPTASRLVAWTEIEQVRADSRSHLGLSARTLEIDAGPLLVILSRRALGGAEPSDVAAIITTYLPPH